MAAGAFVPFTANMVDPLVSRTINLETDTFVMVLLSASYTPNRNTQATFSDISAFQISGSGYTAGGEVMTGLDVTITAGVGKWDSNDVVWNPATLTAKYAAIVRRAGGSVVPGDLLICYSDLNTDSGSATISSTAGPFTVFINAAGIITFSANAS